jgi:hypothetical protein
MSPTAPSVHEKKEFASELKFLLCPAKAMQVLSWARERLVADPNAGGPAGDGYEITSLYFDTAHFDVFHHRRGMHRSKFRVRRYGGPIGPIFLERKLKAHGRLAKCRSPVALEELGQLGAVTLPPGWSGQWFHARVAARRLGPVCQITYQRLARVLLTSSGPIRLTMDTGLRVLPVAGMYFDDSPGALPVLSDEVVLEIKYRRELPVLFRELVSSFQLSPRPFSKYRAAITTLGLANTPTGAISPGSLAPVSAYA